MYEIAVIMSVSCVLLIIITVGLPTYLTLKNVRNPRERAFTVRLAFLGTVFCLLLTVFIYFCIYGLLSYGPRWSRYIWAAILVGEVIYLPGLFWLVRTSNRSLARIRLDENKNPAR